jgi:hypothetical protein
MRVDSEKVLRRLACITDDGTSCLEGNAMQVLFVAGKLYLSEHIFRHHLKHIYDKIGVRIRVAATLFAVDHDLLN